MISQSVITDVLMSVCSVHTLITFCCFQLRIPRIILETADRPDSADSADRESPSLSCNLSPECDTVMYSPLWLWSKIYGKIMPRPVTWFIENLLSASRQAGLHGKVKTEEQIGHSLSIHQTCRTSSMLDLRLGFLWGDVRCISIQKRTSFRSINLN